MIQFSCVHYGFGSGSFALRDISFSVDVEERVCLLGGNGSGKSTLLKLAAGLIKPQSGDVIIGTVSTRAEREFNSRRARIGFIFQNPDDQILTSSVRAELAFTLENLNVGRTEIENRSAEMARRFGLEGVLDRHPATLSAGEKQRLVLAATLISKPEILILDEPSSYLDQKGCDLLAKTLSESRDLCILAATQHLTDLEQFERVFLLEGGAIVFDGSVEEFRSSERYKAIAAGRGKRSGHDEVAAAKGEDVRVQGVKFEYFPGERCLENINLQIPAGSVTALVGDSGCGKSTLALLVAGLQIPAAGEIWIGAVSCSADERLRKVGVVFQIPEATIFAETVFEEIAFGLRNQGIESGVLNNRVERALLQVGLHPRQFLDRNPFTLSAGEQRLVAIAAIVALERPVVIFDESTAGLDWHGVARIRELLLRLRGEGRTVIVISHDCDFVNEVADSVITLKAGRVAEHE